jgi:hypothetical protein
MLFPVLNLLKSENEPIAFRAASIPIHLLDPIIVDNMSREISIDSSCDQLHL